VDYRDDREAMRLRAAELERERDEARREVERLKQEKAWPKPTPMRRSRAVGSPAFVAMLVGLGIAGTVVGLSLTFLTGSPQPTLAPVALAPSGPSPATAAPLDRHASARWTGVVKTARGRVLAAGAPCTVSGDFTSDGTSRVTADVNVECGGSALYRWADALGSGMEMRQCDVWEGPGDAPGTYHYRLGCQDQGVRSGGRPQMTVDTLSRSVVVFQDAPPAWRVEIEVPQFSDPRPGPPLYVGNTLTALPFERTEERTGRVTVVVGAAPAPARAPCTVRVSPSGPRYNCRVEVVCGGTPIYGASDFGFTSCELEDGRAVRAHDPVGSATEGDPMLTMDLSAGSVVVSDDPPTGTWSVTVALDAATGTAPAP
jgi:hypothetical protein